MMCHYQPVLVQVQELRSGAFEMSKHLVCFKSIILLLDYIHFSETKTDICDQCGLDLLAMETEHQYQRVLLYSVLTAKRCILFPRSARVK